MAGRIHPVPSSVFSVGSASLVLLVSAPAPASLVALDWGSALVPRALGKLAWPISDVLPLHSCARGVRSMTVRHRHRRHQSEPRKGADDECMIVSMQFALTPMRAAALQQMTTPADDDSCWLQHASSIIPSRPVPTDPRLPPSG